MRNLYSESNRLACFLLFTVMLLGTSYSLQAQLRVPFTQRTSQFSPDKEIYNIRGDFAMFGNTNLTLQNYSNTTANSNNQMIYVDVDGNSNTLNSSSADLVLSTENGAIPACSNIIYAGLYWSGRSSNAASSPNTFTVIKNGVTKIYDKRKVQLRGPGTAAYTEITASPNDIYYPTTNDGFMYSAYAEVTDYVKAHGIGQYTVADMALIEGNGGTTGYYGGWSMVVVYENTQMKYRDVTIFDGHAYVAGNVTADFTIPVSGFRTVQAGPVNVKIGVMAGEGDQNISGDGLDIERWDQGDWKHLEHDDNTQNNFFNSSIHNGGTPRNPFLQNNTGLDIAMFNVDNHNNEFITNNQTSTNFKYLTNQDTYTIFAFVLAVDAYIPQPEGNLVTVSINGQPVDGGALETQPGDEIEYKIFVRNRGTEPINNTKLIVPVPYNTSFINGSITNHIYFSPLPTPNSIMYNPLEGANGSIVWNIGTLPLPANPNTLLGDVTFKFKITEDCTLLKNATCQNVAAVNGFLSGVGAITGTAFQEMNLIQGYEQSGPCIGQAILAPLLITINALDFVNLNCSLTPPVSSYEFCSPGANIPITSLTGGFPPGSRFYNQYPVTFLTTEYNINNPFPSTVGTSQYYAIPPGAIAGCYFPFTITVTTVASQPSAPNVSYCKGAIAEPLTATPSNSNYTLYYYASINGIPQVSITPSTANAGTFTYYVSEGWSATCLGPKKAITVVINQSPTMTAPANVTLQGCATTAITPLPYSATPTGITVAQFTAAGGTINLNGNSPYLLTYSDTSAGTCSAVITRTFSLVTGCGTITTTQTITVNDTTAPVISALPGVTTINCPAIPVFATASATDNCGSFTLLSNDVTTSTCEGTYSITRTWTATDACGNVSTKSQTINVQDVTPPVIGPLPGATTISCPATPQFATPTATDACCTTVTLTFVDVTTPGDCAGEYTIVRTWTATDDCGNSATASQTIHVEDTTAPVISGLPEPSTIECHATPVFAQATAVDSCGSAVTLSSVDTTTMVCMGTYTIVRTWTATDACGNTSTATQTISASDTVPPVISDLPSPSTIECDQTPVFATPTAVDACCTATLTFADVITPGACDGSYTITRTWTAVDMCENYSTATQIINVEDTTAPVFDPLPGPITLTCTSTGRISPNFDQATATDNCSAVTLTFADVITNGSCEGSYSIVRNWTATDDCGNTSTASQTFIIEDTTAPAIGPLPGPTTISCPATPQFVVPTVTDECASETTLTFVDVTTPGDCAGEYTIVRTWTAVDQCNNTATASQTINVEDTTAPVISDLPEPSTIECHATPVFAQATATDSCGSAVTLSSVDTTTTVCMGTYTIVRTWTATDACGNTATATQTISASDTVPPVISELPPPSTIECDQTPVFATPTAVDACCTATLTFKDVITPGDCDGSYTITRTWTAVDMCENFSYATQVINVEDTTAPVIAPLPNPTTLSCDNSNGGIVLNFEQATATDNCSAVTLTFTDVTTNGSCAGSYTVVRTWTATDDCGNTSTATQTISVNDNTAPTAPTAPADVMLSCAGDVPPMITLTATDNCDGSITVSGVDVVTPGTCADSFTIVRTWTFTDACGNTSFVSQTITVGDTVAPVAPAAPADVTVSCEGEVPANVILTAADACGGSISSQGVDVVTPGSCANSYTIVRTWTFTDACGNTSSVSQTINVNDTVAPVISDLPAATTI
ncbi:MAG TPA: hypothetical protein VGB50_05955, partial [Flavobacterium sp.]